MKLSKQIPLYQFDDSFRRVILPSPTSDTELEDQFYKRKSIRQFDETELSKDLLGELKNSSDINSKIIYLHQDLFKETFGKMFSVFLHELAHASGNDDGSREFSDSLTVLIQKCIDNNSEITKF